MTTNAERQKAYRERKRAAAERREFEKFAATAAFGPRATDEEKYAAFRRHRQAAMADERRRKKAEAARERRKRLKSETTATAAPAAASKEEVRRRRRAQAARDKYRRDKLERQRRASDVDECVGRDTVRGEHSRSCCSVCDRPLRRCGPDAAGKGRVCHTCYNVLLDETIPRPSKHLYYQFIRYSMWLEEGDVTVAAERVQPQQQPSAAAAV